MATVIASALGGSPVRMTANTVMDVKETLQLMSHTASVNGDPAGDSAELQDEDFVSLAPAVKGG